jgi:hypothetical protein
MAHRGKEVLRYEQRRTAIDPKQLLKQRTMLLSIAGGQATDKKGQINLPVETPQARPALVLKSKRRTTKAV